MAAVVEGDPGAGKSRLLTEFQRRARVPEQIWCSGYEPEGAIPLAASRALLRRLLTVSEWGEIVDAMAFGAPSPSEPVEPVRLFEAAHRALVSLGPTLVIVDDLHWADGLSTALFHYLARAGDQVGQPLALVFAARRGPALQSLRASLEQVLSADRFVGLELGPLGREAGTTLALELAPGLDQDQATLIWERARGSPFWIQLLAGSDRLDTEVGKLIVGRLNAAGEDALPLVGVLALAGHPLSTEDVAYVHEWSALRAERAVAAADRNALVTRTAMGLSLAHDLIRQAVLGTIPPSLTRRIHRKLGRWLEQSADDDDQLLLEALEHRRAGGEQAVGLALRLARSPRRRLMAGAGLRRLVAIGTGADPRDPEVSDLWFELASLCAEQGEHDEAFRLWSQLSRVMPDSAAGAVASLHASRAAMHAGRREDAWRQLDLARARTSADPVLAVEVLAQEAGLRSNLDRQSDAARITAARALDGARSLAGAALGPANLQGDARRAYLAAALAGADAARMGDDPIEMLVLAEEVAASAAGVDDTIEASALVQGAMALRFLGRNGEAEVRLRDAWDTARRRVLPQAVLEIGAVLGRVLLSMGRIPETKDILLECSSLGARLTEFGPGRNYLVTLPSLVEVTTGDWRKAVAMLGVAASQEPEPHYRLHAHLERAAALARVDPDHAEEEVHEAAAAALADARTATCRRCLTEATVRGAEALARVGSSAEAESLLSSAHVPVVDLYNSFWRDRATVAVLTVVDPPAAVPALERLKMNAQQLDLGLEAVAVRLDLGCALTSFDRAHAAAVLQAAGAAAERFGATTDVALAERRLRSLGVRTWRRESTARREDSLMLLTSRERDIARLVAAGASNPEIASSLFLSRKTVERHISNIFAKLGLRNRAALAALVPNQTAEGPTQGSEG